jgi:uncharacterized pyridoxamine 5'-phosphate oxidase family protein
MESEAYLVETSEFVAFVRDRGLGVIATLGPRGTPQAAVVALVATDLGEVVFGTERESRKFANIQQRPDVALAIGWDDDEVSVQCEGIADEPGGAAMDRCMTCYLDRYPGEQPMMDNGKHGLVRVRMNWIRYDDPRPHSRRFEETTPALTSD